MLKFQSRDQTNSLLGANRKIGFSSFTGWANIPPAVGKKRSTISAARSGTEVPSAIAMVTKRSLRTSSPPSLPIKSMPPRAWCQCPPQDPGRGVCPRILEILKLGEAVYGLCPSARRGPPGGWHAWAGVERAPAALPLLPGVRGRESAARHPLRTKVTAWQGGVQAGHVNELSAAPRSGAHIGALLTRAARRGAAARLVAFKH